MEKPVSIEVFSYVISGARAVTIVGSEHVTHAFLSIRKQAYPDLVPYISEKNYPFSAERTFSVVTLC